MLYVVKALLDGVCDAVDAFASKSKLSSDKEFGKIIKRDAVYVSCYLIASDDIMTDKELALLSDVMGKPLLPLEVSEMIVGKEKLTFMLTDTYNKLKAIDIELGAYSKRSSTAYQYIAFLKSFAVLITGVDGIKKLELYDIKELFDCFDGRLSEIPEQ